MNAACNSAENFIHENDGGFGSDSDANTDDETPEFYQPISASADDDDEEPNLPDRQNLNSDEFNSFHHLSRNGYSLHAVENGVSSLDLRGDDDDETEEESEEEERIREASEAAMRIALRDDDRRRNAPLTPDNAARVMEAMRGVSFGGFAPDWAGRVPDDQIINQIRRIRRPIPSATTTTSTVQQ